MTLSLLSIESLAPCRVVDTSDDDAPNVSAEEDDDDDKAGSGADEQAEAEANNDNADDDDDEDEPPAPPVRRARKAPAKRYIGCDFFLLFLIVLYSFLCI